MSDDNTPPEGGFSDATPDQPTPPPPPYGSEVPPPPAYGDTPPPYTPAPPAPPGSFGGGYSPVEAIKYGWGKFTASPSSLLIPALIFIAVLFAVEIAVQLLLRATITGTRTCTEEIFGTQVETQCGPSFVMSLFAAGIASLFVSFVSQVLGAGLIKSALNVADHKPVSAGDVFGYATKSNVLVTGLLVSVATFIGTLLCYLPGLIIGFLLMFSMFYVVDKDQEPMEAIKSSVNLVTSKLGDTILFALLGGLVLIVGAILCLVGLLAAIPVVLAGAAYTFRVLNNEPVTPVDAR